MIRSLFSTRSLVTLAAVAVAFFCADVASAQDAAGRSLIDLTSAFSVGLVVIGAAYGIHFFKDEHNDRAAGNEVNIAREV